MKQDFKSLYNPSLREQKEQIITKDGTKTLYSKEFDECYHSTNDGALNESLNKHIIPASNLSLHKNSLTILDICYGLGFNTLTTIYYYQKHRPNTKLHIISPELDEGLVKSLKEFEYPKEFEGLKEIIQSVSSDLFYEDSSIRIEVLIGDAREMVKSIDKEIDIIYQDAFSPKKNPALWTREWFLDLKSISSKDLILTTYSSATPVRLAMYESGFNIYTPPKADVRSGTIASLIELDLEPIDMELKKIRNPNAKALVDCDLFYNF